MMLRRLRTLLLASALAGLLALLAASPVAAEGAPASGAVRPPGASSVPCPPGMTPTTVTSPASPRSGAPAATGDPSVSTLPDGRTVHQSCAVAAPVPMRGPQIAPEHTVGGAGLAAQGVLTDRPSDVPSPPELPHVSYVLADMTTGQVLAAKSPHALLYPASTLKTLTALVALPRLDPGQVVVATPEDVNAEGTRVGMLAGNPYTVEDLVNGMLMVSGNDAAYAIARAYGGRPQILADMNAAAARLGAWDTRAVDPSGLDADGQRTSAYDLALIGRAAMALPAFRRHAVVLQAQFPGGTDATGKMVPPFQIQNHNPIIDGYPGTVGVKSGYTTLARNTFIAAVTRGGRTLLLAEMGSVVRQTEPTEALLDWGFAYAGRLRPVGTLVDPGAPQPPEWAADPAVAAGPASAASGSTDPQTTSEPETTLTIAAAPGSGAADPSAASGLRVPDAVTEPLGVALVALAAALVVVLTWWLSWSVRRRRGAHQR